MALSNHSLVAVIESCYRAADTEREWLTHIAAVASDVFHRDVAAYTYTALPSQHLRISEFVTTSAALRRSNAVDEANAGSPQLAARVFREAPRVELLSEATRDSPQSPIEQDSRSAWRELHSAGVCDVLAVRGGDPCEGALRLSVLRPHAKPVGARTRAALAGLCGHLGTSLALQRMLRVETADAIVSTQGLEHRSNRVGAADVLHMGERLRGRRLSQAETQRLWGDLYSGGWSVLDYVDRDGKRFILARRNDVLGRDPCAVSEHEHQVVLRVVRGESNKRIGYELGVATTTVATHLASALRKLRLRSRRELIQMFHQRPTP